MYDIHHHRVWPKCLERYGGEYPVTVRVEMLRFYRSPAGVSAVSDGLAWPEATVKTPMQFLMG